MAKLEDMTDKKFWNLTVLESCCKTCNFAKRTQSEKEFANWIVGMSDWTRAFQQTVYAKAADLLASRMIRENF